MSGVTVPTTITPMSSGVSPARAIALIAASLPRSDVATPGIDDVPLADAGPLQDPLVGRVDHLLEVGVGQHARRHVGRQRRDRRRPSADARGLAARLSRRSVESPQS